MRTLGDVGAGHTLGRYELLVPVARGGMAVVWAARMKGSRGFQKLVAVKSMLPSLSDDDQFEEMFLAEAELAAQIHHPHVCEILDLGEQEGVLFIVMEWIEGESLSLLMKLAKTKGGVPLPVATRIARDAAHGLHAAHELKKEDETLVGLVHRDVSPQNVLVSYDGVVKIVDFGIAKATQGDQGRTAAGVMKGKAQYMSPEQALGKPVDRRTDVFALGIVLYQLVTGKHPFRKESDIATLAEICGHNPVTPPSKLVPACPPELDAAVARALAKDPAKRFDSMHELAAVLEAVVGKLPDGGGDVRGWVRSVAADRAEKKRAVIREAQKVADERKGQEPSTQLPNALLALSAGAPSSPELAGPGSMSGPQLVVTSPSSPTQTAPSSASFGGPASETSTPAVTRSGQVQLAELTEEPRARPSVARWALVALVGVLAVGAAAFVARPSLFADVPLLRDAIPHAPAAHAAQPTAAAPPPSAAPAAPASASASSSAEAAEPAPSADATASASAAVRAPAHAAGRAAQRPKSEPAATATNAPKIMNPGF